jgi:hypothetical protein
MPGASTPTDALHRKYKLNRQAVFKAEDDGSIAGELGVTSFSLSLDFYRLLLEFATPASIQEVHARAAAGLGIEEFARLFEDIVSNGLLKPIDGPVEATMRLPSLADVISPAFLAKLKDPGELGEGFRAGRFCYVRNAFDPSFARKVLAELEAIPQWTTFTGKGHFYGERCHRLHEDVVLPTATMFRGILDHEDTKKLLTDFSGLDCSGPIDAFRPSLWLPGDFLTSHRDFPGAVSVAMVWHLTPTWDPAWGGHFYWEASRNSFAPQFNDVCMFVVNEDSYHSVTPVDEMAGARRYTFAGWFGPEAKAGFKSGYANDQHSYDNQYTIRQEVHGWYSGPALKAYGDEVFLSSR